MKKGMDYYSLRIKDAELFCEAKARAAKDGITLGEFTERALHLAMPGFKKKRKKPCAN